MTCKRHDLAYTYNSDKERGLACSSKESTILMHSARSVLQWLDRQWSVTTADQRWWQRTDERFDAIVRPKIAKQRQTKRCVTKLIDINLLLTVDKRYHTCNWGIKFYLLKNFWERDSYLDYSKIYEMLFVEIYCVVLRKTEYIQMVDFLLMVVKILKTVMPMS